LASIGQLAAGVGHEINNPLSIISGQIFVLDLHLKEQGIDDPELQLGFERIQKSVTRIANIVSSLKSFARAEDEDLSHFPLQDLIDETIAMLSDLFAKEGVELRQFGPAVSGEIAGHRNRVQQVLVNLLMNAKDATEGKSSRQVRIGGRHSAGRLEIIVSDNGCGIPDEFREKIFEPFFTTKGVGNRGTGIGLAIVRNILKEHHAKIRVNSVSGEGTEFVVEFPEVVVSVARLGIDAGVSRSQSALQGQRILVVDDEVDIRQVLYKILTAQGASVELAQGGREALGILRKQAFDVVLCDIKMPGMGGFQLYEELQQLPLRPVFILITGGVELSQDQQRLIHQERLKVIPKPFNLEQLLMMLQTAKGIG
jgi:CheY-like chemotaxis protein/two-component sensor histidine kinase